MDVDGVDSFSYLQDISISSILQSINSDVFNQFLMLVSVVDQSMVEYGSASVKILQERHTLM